MYYIIENQFRPDGQINNSIISRADYYAALSYYYERMSKMVATELYTKVAITILNEDLNTVQQNIIETQYKEPVEEEE